MKVIVKGPALTRTGYGEHCRFVLRALRQFEGLDIYLAPVNWGQSSWVWEDTEERNWIDSIVLKLLSTLGQEEPPVALEATTYLFK